MKIDELYEKLLDITIFRYLSLIICFFLIPFWLVWKLIKKLFSTIEYISKYDD